jgi:hypothetical protein
MTPIALFCPFGPSGRQTPSISNPGRRCACAGMSPFGVRISLQDRSSGVCLDFCRARQDFLPASPADGVRIHRAGSRPHRCCVAASRLETSWGRDICGLTPAAMGCRRYAAGLSAMNALGGVGTVGTAAGETGARGGTVGTAAGETGGHCCRRDLGASGLPVTFPACFPIIHLVRLCFRCLRPPLPPPSWLGC